MSIKGADILVLLLTMIVVNHCGVNNTIYRTCHNSVLYGSFPVPDDSDLVVNFLSEDIDFDLLCTHTREYVIGPHGTEPDDVTNTQTHPPISISHVVVKVLHLNVRLVQDNKGEYFEGDNTRSL